MTIRRTLWPAAMVTCACLFGCDSSNVAPPKIDSPAAKEMRNSTVVISVSAQLADVEQKLNEEVPNPLLVVDQDLDACIPAKYVSFCTVPRIVCHNVVFNCHASGCAVPVTKTKISPDISCRIKGKVTRGPIQLSGSGQNLEMSMPVSVDISAKDVGGIIESVSATGSANVRATSSIDIDTNWHPIAKVDADYSWKDKIGVDILGQRVTFASKVDPKIQGAIDKFEKELPAKIEGLDLEDKAASAWSRGFKNVRLNEQPPIWLRFSPQSVGYSGYQVTGNTISFSLMASGLAETFIGAQPEDPTPTKLPQLVKALPTPHFQFYLPILVEYESLEDSAAKALRVGEEQQVTVPSVGNVAVTILDLSLYGTTDGALAIGIKLNADPPGSFFDTRGTVWFSTTPTFDNEGKVVGVKQLDTRGDTNSNGLNLLLSILRVPAVNERITAALKYDLSKKYERALKEANKALTREVADDLLLRSEIVNAVLEDVIATADGLSINLALNGAATLEYRTSAQP